MQKETQIERNVLTMKKTISILQWLQSKKETPIWKTSTKESLAEMATAELGFKICVANIKSVAKASQIELPNVRGKTKDVLPQNRSRQRMGQMRKAILDLYAKVGEQPPEYLNWTVETE